MPEHSASFQTRLAGDGGGGAPSWQGLPGFPWELSGGANEEAHFAFIERLSSGALKAQPQTVIKAHTCEAGEQGYPHFQR